MRAALFDAGEPGQTGGVRTLLIATRNAHKVQEIRAVLGVDIEYRTLGDFPEAPTIAETGETFQANARLKSEGLARWLFGRGDPGSRDWKNTRVLADDSGLEVDALGGEPGVHSARFAAGEFGLQGNAPDGANNQKLLRLLAAVRVERRTARFRCALALTRLAELSDVRLFEGSCEGRIGFLQRGAHGFGYDPLFIPEGFTPTLAELGEFTKNTISHRARALMKLKAWLDQEGTG